MVTILTENTAKGCTIEVMEFSSSPQSAPESRSTSNTPIESPAQSTSKKVSGYKSFSGIVIFLVVVIGLASLLNTFVFQSYYVDGTSMEPTLQNNDRLIISKVERTFSQLSGHSDTPTRGQVVVLDSSVSPLTEAKDEQIVKRVIGLPGEHIHIENGEVTIKNPAHPHGFHPDQALGLSLDPTYLEGNTTQDFDIPADNIYVLGDNRGPGGSYDSRFFGPVEASKIVGRLWVRVFPLTALRAF